VTTASNGYAVTDDAALATVDQLEQVPVLTQNLKDETTTAANLQKDVDDANTLISTGKVTVAGLQLQLQDQDKACSTQVTALQGQLKKQKLQGIVSRAKWFLAGFATGFITGVFK
jgi:hypothetical protein